MRRHGESDDGGAGRPRSGRFPRVALVASTPTVHLWRWAEMAATVADITVIDYSGLEPLYDFSRLGRFRKLPLTPPPSQQLRNFQQILAECRRHDIVNFQFVGAGVPYLAAGVRGRVVLSFWGSDALTLHSEGPALRGWLFKRAVARAEALTYNSPVVADRLRGFGSKARRIDWPIDTSVFQPAASARQRSELRQEHGCEADELVMLSTRLVKPLYRIDKVIDMCRPTLMAGRARLFIHVPPNADRGYLAHCQRAAGDLPVVFSEVNRSPEQLADLYRMADVSINAASSDSLPSSIVEALACGCAVLAADDTPGYRLLRSELPVTLAPVAALPLEDLWRFADVDADAQKAEASRVAERFTEEAFRRALVALYT